MVDCGHLCCCTAELTKYEPCRDSEFRIQNLGFQDSGFRIKDAGIKTLFVNRKDDFYSTDLYNKNYFSNQTIFLWSFQFLKKIYILCKIARNYV